MSSHESTENHILYASIFFSDSSLQMPSRKSVFRSTKELLSHCHSLQITRRIPARCVRARVHTHPHPNKAALLPHTLFQPLPQHRPRPPHRCTTAVQFSPPVPSLSPSCVHRCQPGHTPGGKLNEIATGRAVNDWVGLGRREELLGKGTGHRWKKHGVGGVERYAGKRKSRQFLPHEKL